MGPVGDFLESKIHLDLLNVFGKRSNIIQYSPNGG